VHQNFPQKLSRKKVWSFFYNCLIIQHEGKEIKRLTLLYSQMHSYHFGRGAKSMEIIDLKFSRSLL